MTTKPLIRVTCLVKILDRLRDVRLVLKSRFVCKPYFCPASGETECCPDHSGWDVCCGRPDLHRRVRGAA